MNAPVSTVQLDSEKGNNIGAAADTDDLKAFPDEVPDYDAQRGIQKIEATTLSWSKWSLAALLIKYTTTTTESCQSSLTSSIAFGLYSLLMASEAPCLLV